MSFSQSGLVQLSLRDKVGGLLPGGFKLHYTDVDLAPPPKRERVMVLAGRDKGKLGTVNVSVLLLFSVRSVWIASFEARLS